MNFYPNPDGPANHMGSNPDTPHYQLILGEIIHKWNLQKLLESALFSG
jgi:hypothetical protein